MRSLRVALAQINPAVGDLDGNVARIVAAIRDAEAAACDLVALPELAVTGYPPEDLLLRRPFVSENLAALDRIQAATVGLHVTAVVGFVDLAPDALQRRRRPARRPARGRVPQAVPAQLRRLR